MLDAPFDTRIDRQAFLKDFPLLQLLVLDPSSAHKLFKKSDQTSVC